MNADRRLQAQQPRPWFSVTDIAARARKDGNTGFALAALRQQRGSYSRQELDAIADTLAAIAISSPGTDAASVSLRMNAADVLMLAGSGERGTPYPGAAERLLRIVERSREPSIRSMALTGLTRMPDQARARDLLRRVAVSENPSASAAIDRLTRDMGPEGLGIVHQLYRLNQAREPGARRALERVAEQHGWK